MGELTAEQKEAIESTDFHVLVSAGAGAGKTLVLVERYLHVLKVDPTAQISDIVAVTYTRKAADEMRTRLKQRLKELAAAGECLPESSSRWSELLSEIDGARIGTIHSLCETILKSHATDAGIDPDFRVLEDLERAELLQAAVDESIRHLFEDPSGAQSCLLDFPVETLSSWISSLVGPHVQYRQHRSLFGTCTMSEMAGHARRFIAGMIERALDEIQRDQEYTSASRFILLDSGFDEGSALEKRRCEVSSLLTQIEDATASPKDRWQALETLGQIKLSGAGGEKGATLREALKSVRDICSRESDRLKPDLLEPDRRAFQILSALIQISDQALAGYEKRKRQAQKLDFDDLIERTHSLLAGTNSRPRNHLRRSLKAVLVDEFQDTNDVQVELIRGLIGEHTRLFVIGDDKQSIYKFQGADVATFNSCQELIRSIDSRHTAAGLNRDPQIEIRQRDCADGLELGSGLRGSGKVLGLSYSFRSHPEIVSFVNSLFSKVFEGSTSGAAFRSRHQALRAFREDTRDIPRVEVISFDDRTGENDESQGREAEIVVRWLKDKIASGAPIYDKGTGISRPAGFGDFAILLQAGSDFQAIEAALARAEIPFVSYSGSGFLDRQEIADLESLLCWLASPQDSHSLLAALRSGMFALPDDLIHSCHAGRRQSLWQSLKSSAESTGEPLLLQAVELLSDLLAQGGRLRLSTLCRQVLLSTAYDVTVLCTPGGRQKSRNLWKFVTLAARFDHLSLTEFLNALKTMRALGVKNLSDAPLTAEDSVKVMTIHKSKGLEFGVVILPRLDRKIHAINKKLLTGKDFGLAVDTTRDSKDPKPVFFMAADRLEKLMDEEEKKRLLYVALTRARDHLALFLPKESPRYLSLGTWLRKAMELDSLDGSETLRTFTSTGGITSTYLLKPVHSVPVESSHRESSTLSGSERLELHEDFSLRLVHAMPKPADVVARPVGWQALIRVSPGAGDASTQATVLGSFFHAVMASLSRELDCPSEERLSEILCSAEFAVYHPGVQQSLISAVKELIALFQTSPLRAMLLTCRQRMHEVPYTCARLTDAEGRPDLIIEDSSNQWHIIDYKTDHLASVDVERHARQHRAQLCQYLTDFESITGHSALGWIYFAQLGRLERVDVAEPAQLTLNL